jgi:hypothetical protein
MHGLRQHYLVGVAVDPGDPETVVVSASPGPYLAYNPGRAEANLYRKVGSAAFEHLSQGLPEAQGTIASRLASHPSAPGMLYAANNHGLFYSQDGGLQWETIEIDWPPRAFAQGIAALAVFSD